MIIASVAGSNRPQDTTRRGTRMGDIQDDKTVSTPSPARRGRGRPRKDAQGSQAVKKHTKHDNEHFVDIRLRRELANIIHKQFRILEKDIPEAVRLLSHLTKRANGEFQRITREINEAIGKETDGRARDNTGKFARVETPDVAAPGPVEATAEIDPLGDLPPVEMPPEPEAPVVAVEVPAEMPPASLPEEKKGAPEAATGPRKPISERGKLVLKAWKKENPA